MCGEPWPRPYGSLKRGKLTANATEIATIALKEGAYGLIVGLPLSMDGTAGPAAQAVRDWTHALSSATGLPAALWDERLSSAAVNRFLINEADLTRAKRAEVVDRAAAAWMLQAALDAREQSIRRARRQAGYVGNQRRAAELDARPDAGRTCGSRRDGL